MKNFKFTIRGNEYEVEILNLENNIAEIEVNGTSYQVEIDKEIQTPKTPKLVRAAVKNPAGAERIQKVSTSGAVTIKAPLPGSIMSIAVKEGDSVKKGDKLLVMEAMKMENNVLAEKDGTIGNIKVSVGQSVLQGDDLLEIA